MRVGRICAEDWQRAPIPRVGAVECRHLQLAQLGCHELLQGVPQAIMEKRRARYVLTAMLCFQYWRATTRIGKSKSCGCSDTASRHEFYLLRERSPASKSLQVRPIGSRMYPS